MEFEVRVPAVYGDAIPLIRVAEAMAVPEAMAGRVAPHPKLLSMRMREFGSVLLGAARSGTLPVCDYLGSPGSPDEIVRRLVDQTGIEAGDDDLITSLMHLRAKLPALNTWAAPRHDRFRLVSDLPWGDGWTAESGALEVRRLQEPAASNDERANENEPGRAVPQQEPEQTKQAGATDLTAHDRVVTKSVLVKELQARWPNIEACLSNASRNDLNAARRGKRGWSRNQVEAWGRDHGHLTPEPHPLTGWLVKAPNLP